MLEPIEIYEEAVWEILDPNNAQLIAIFYDGAAALEYIEWRNEAVRISNKNPAAKVPPATANTPLAAGSTSPPSIERPDSQMNSRGESSSVDQSPCADEAKPETPAEENRSHRAPAPNHPRSRPASLYPNSHKIKLDICVHLAHESSSPSP